MVNYIKIRTKNHTARPLRQAVEVNDNSKRVVLRLGSKTELREIFSDNILRSKQIIELNKVEACRNSANKMLMKRCFNREEVPTALWCSIRFENNMPVPFDGTMQELTYPIIAKHKFGAQGRGNYKLDTQEALIAWANGKNMNEYIFEKFYTYSKEYRLHVTKNGCFYTCRKMLKRDTPEDRRWQRHDDNSVWIVEENPDFAKPRNWQAMIDASVKALLSVGLDIGAVDLKCQTKMGEPADFIVLEVNSAPSMGERTIVEYKKKLNEMVNG